MGTSKERAAALLKAWKGDAYCFGFHALARLGSLSRPYGSKALVVSSQAPYMQEVNTRILSQLRHAGIRVLAGGIVLGARPNAPREDVYRLESYILHYRPDCLLVAGGGSGIDALKGANVLALLGGAVTPDIDFYFGTGAVGEALQKTGLKLLPLIAVQTSASSGAHLTKYANITDPAAGQKKLIVDEALVPPLSFFDYSLSASMPPAVTIDGALDALSHTFEVFCGASGETYALAAQLAETAFDLVIEYTPVLLKDPHNLDAREALGLAADLGGYAIMIGGTSGAHLTSFSMVDIAAHGTACGIMNPYYAVFYSTAIEKQLHLVGGVLARQGYITTPLEGLRGRGLAVAFAEGMIRFARSIHAPATLKDLPGFTEAHLIRALQAAKDPQLEMKLKNMPVPLSAAAVDTYMEPILRAGATGDLSLIKTLED
ncbi:MAG: iron-containing alcohol dehydrogenase [Treponema sp.]|jgi:alcohol dehydrogenase|nr:iron-containing alcohol dehydrogenase [Treponema sp.]